MSFKGIFRVENNNKIKICKTKQGVQSVPPTGIFDKNFWETQNLNELNFKKEKLKNFYNNIEQEDIKEFILINEVFLNAIFADDVIHFFNEVGASATLLLIKAISDSDLCETYQKVRITKSLIFSHLLDNENIEKNIKELLVANIDLM